MKDTHSFHQYSPVKLLFKKINSVTLTEPACTHIYLQCWSNSIRKIDYFYWVGQHLLSFSTSTQVRPTPGQYWADTQHKLASFAAISYTWSWVNILMWLSVTQEHTDHFFPKIVDRVPNCKMMTPKYCENAVVLTLKWLRWTVLCG